MTFLIFITALTVLAEGARSLLYQTTAESNFKLSQSSQAGLVATKTTHAYDIYRSFAEGIGETLYLISSSKKIDQDLNSEGASGYISWTVRTGPRMEHKIWSKAESATVLNIHGYLPYMTTGLSGCCAELTGYRLYNIETGKMLMSFNDFKNKEVVTQPYSLEVPNSSLAHRFIGVISQDSTRDRDFTQASSGKASVALVKYASDVLKQKLQVEMAVAAGHAASILEVSLEKDPMSPASASIELIDGNATLWNIDGEENPHLISGVLLQIIVDGGLGSKVIKIPVKNDQFDLNSAEIPNEVLVRSLAL